ncbi:hypothetical protein KIW84_011178 [Lathyrus oleraceus]|uniref:Uncharacterized protein n=1 Tax=Pisum sativum TaxID=3888 RepID=A0A9D5BEB7_PEA|nr:hypothetical protein KIW84_011178 [Pisum sativum]
MLASMAEVDDPSVMSRTRSPPTAASVVFRSSSSSSSFGPTLSIKLQDKNYLLWNQQVEVEGDVVDKFGLCFVMGGACPVEGDVVDKFGLCFVMGGACPGNSDMCNSLCLKEKHYPKGGQCNTDNQGNDLCCCNH